MWISRGIWPNQLLWNKLKAGETRLFFFLVKVARRAPWENDTLDSL
jgi:hypothetical protein